MSADESLLLTLTHVELERFWSKVQKAGPDECWPWTAAKTFGYGAWRCRKIGFRANRVALILSSQKLLGSLDALHTCDEPSCCNPKHLFAGTHKQNVDDMMAKGRHWRKGTAKLYVPRPHRPTKEVPPLSESDIARFWAKVDKHGPDECWPWTAAIKTCRFKSGLGYGVLRVAGRNIEAHRIAYALAYGGVNGAAVRHKCDFPLCCNAKHLVSGTQADNIQDQFDRGRAHRVPPGEKHPKAKLTELDVKMIRVDLTAGASCADLARTYDVTPATIQDIKWGRTWQHLL